jgi:hypothetical protein
MQSFLTEVLDRSISRLTKISVPFSEFPDKAHTFLREDSIANSKGLIDNQNICINMRDNGKSQSDIHPTGIIFDWLINEITNIGKFHNIIKFKLYFASGQTIDSSI